MPLHLEKKAIRAIGIAESFRAKDEFSTLAGVVMRSDLVVDGIAFGKLTVSGSDATDSVTGLFSKLGRNDVNAILLSGSVLSLYNIIDVDRVYSRLRVPTLALTFSRSKADLERNIEAKFPAKVAKQKIELLQKLGAPEKIGLKTGYGIFVKRAGIVERDAKRLLDRFTLQGSVPEPVRVAKLLAKAASVATSIA